jgi:hypothetical protein
MEEVDAVRLMDNQRRVDFTDDADVSIHRWVVLLNCNHYRISYFNFDTYQWVTDDIDTIGKWAQLRHALDSRQPNDPLDQLKRLALDLLDAMSTVTPCDMSNIAQNSPCACKLPCIMKHCEVVKEYYNTCKVGTLMARVLRLNLCREWLDKLTKLSNQTKHVKISFTNPAEFEAWRQSQFTVTCTLPFVSENIDDIFPLMEEALEHSARLLRVSFGLAVTPFSI